MLESLHMWLDVQKSSRSVHAALGKIGLTCTWFFEGGDTVRLTGHLRLDSLEPSGELAYSEFWVTLVTAGQRPKTFNPFESLAVDTLQSTCLRVIPSQTAEWLIHGIPTTGSSLAALFEVSTLGFVTQAMTWRTHSWELSKSGFQSLDGYVQ